MSNFFGVEYDILDEITIGDDKYRLVENIKSKRVSVQMYGTMRKEWIPMYVYSDAKLEWQGLKKVKKVVDTHSKK